MSDPLSLFERPIDKKRMQNLFERTETPLESQDIWFLHSVLTQCFLPYKDPKTDRWQRTNGDFSISLGQQEGTCDRTQQANPVFLTY